MNSFEEELGQFAWCQNYISYVNFRKNGLKKAAHNELKFFFEVLIKQDKHTRREFIFCIYKKAFYTGEYSLYVPQNLQNDFIKNDIETWINDEPFNPIPYSLTYEFELVKKSLTIDPNSQFALHLFGKMLINKVKINQHEISHAYPYHGNPIEDIELIKFYLELNKNIENTQIANVYKNELLLLQEYAIKYINNEN